MAKSKTPAKRARRAEARRLRNKAYKSRIKTAEKKYLAALAENNVEQAKANLLQVISLLDKSVNKGILHKNTVARKKSKLVQKFNQLAK
ncbi:SSU ribosomal protein S20P [Thermosyntropha lipolytica DSM 11003]|uniref:Small ribosomal subunit protein bS20 n=1 Tax=Thermosyntropha lipolytica DSM 11003 TaxID=1123382 RepID=A0A1M5N6W4_9FIRM|nr:30S ribosomal protein S20 [Thermosyntropha lipolytica]SHG85172.1 SSU ribosomal protein S20P [Thermosyntropha lipolytica DSM 11003]